MTKGLAVLVSTVLHSLTCRKSNPRALVSECFNLKPPAFASRCVPRRTWIQNLNQKLQPCRILHFLPTGHA